MWNEEVAVYPLAVDRHLVGQRRSDGGDNATRARDPSAESFSESTSKASSFLVHSRFQLDFSSDLLLVPAGVDALVRGRLHGASNMSSLDVTYTRGNRGAYRMPRWYRDRGPGLVMEYGMSNVGQVESMEAMEAMEASRQEMLTMIGRLLGCSAASVLDSKTYFESLGDKETVFRGFSTQDFPCVESVTRWLRLLPCGGQGGLSEALKGLRLLELPYHSIRVRGR
jgi:hypothetical protein